MQRGTTIQDTQPCLRASSKSRRMLTLVLTSQHRRKRSNHVIIQLLTNRIILKFREKARLLNIRQFQVSIDRNQGNWDLTQNLTIIESSSKKIYTKTTEWNTQKTMSFYNILWDMVLIHISLMINMIIFLIKLVMTLCIQSLMRQR